MTAAPLVIMLMKVMGIFTALLGLSFWADPDRKVEMKNMRKQKGLTLIEVLITISIGAIVLAIVAGVVLMSCAGNMGWNKEDAEKNASTFIRELELDVDKFQCNGNDSDGDGYVSCTFKMTDGSTRQYECVGWSWFNEGCREPKLNLNRPQVNINTQND